MNWDIIADNLGMYVDGTGLTLLLTVVSLAIAFIISVVLALARDNAPRPLRWLIFIYVTAFRGTPLLIQLFLIYYGLAQFYYVPASSGPGSQAHSFVYCWLLF